MTNILDIEKTIHAANGNVALAKELFTMLLDELGSRSQEIEISFKNNELDILAHHIHKLYGATAYCVVPQLRKVVQILDQTLKNDSYLQLDELVNQVLTEIQLIVNNGSDLLNQNWE